jgi:hypothetical protein
MHVRQPLGERRTTLRYGGSLAVLLSVLLGLLSAGHHAPTSKADLPLQLRLADYTYDASVLDARVPSAYPWVEDGPALLLADVHAHAELALRSTRVGSSRSRHLRLGSLRLVPARPRRR